MENSQLLFTVPEVAALLRLGRSTIYKLMKSGQLGSITIGTARRVPAAALDLFIQSLKDEEQIA